MALTHRLGIAIIGTTLFAAAGFAAITYPPGKLPARYQGHLDPRGFRPAKLATGTQTGWYVYLFIGGQRVVCANPYVWEGAGVITCDQVVTVDSDKREIPSARSERASEPGPENPFFVPTYSTKAVEDEIDLWNKRLTYKTRNEPRR